MRLISLMEEEFSRLFGSTVVGIIVGLGVYLTYKR